MRIHSLHIEAIGPFPGRHDVDFDELSAGGLFLLEGPTGAGKSTLIDAITYGLYGTLGKALDSRLPSAHAPLADPVIQLVFSTGSGIYKARRTPPYERPKKRGEGFTPQNATAKLWRLSTVDDPVGEPMAATAQEVGAEMQQILGLTRDQFMQTVVLPQGRFSTFLRAKPDERAAVLRDVFGTGIYQQMQDQLAEMSRSVKRTISVAEAEVSAAVRGFTNLLSADDPAVADLQDAGSALDTDAMLQRSGAVVQEHRDRCSAAADARTRATAEEAASRAHLEEQKELERHLARRAALLAESAILSERSDDVASDRERLAAAQRAGTVTGAVRARDTARSALHRAEVAHADACSALAGTEDDDLAGLRDLSGLRAVTDAVTEERGGLADLVRLEAGLADRTHHLQVEETGLHRATAVLERERHELVGRPGTRSQLVAARDELRRTATPVAVARQAAEHRRAIRDAAMRTEALATQCAAARDELAEAGARARRATEQEGDITLRWINSTAGSLAAELEHGAPCPVCGGTEHPRPAPQLPDHATRGDVDEAAARRQRAIDALQEADRIHTRLGSAVAAQLEASHHVPLVEAETALAAAEENAAAAEEAVALIEQADTAITLFDAETETLRASISTSETDIATTTERLRGDREKLVADEQRCRSAAGGCGSVAAHVRLLEARLSRARTLIRTQEEHHDAEVRLADATNALAGAVADAGFEDAEAAWDARLERSALDALQQRIRDHDAALTRVADGLAEESVATLTGEEVVDVPAARARHEQCHEALLAASAAAATTAATLAQCERLRDDLAGTLHRHRQLAQEGASVVRMAELANAGEGNARSTTLSTFVLLRRFEDVVAAANERLTIMSDGRFSLLRIDEREGRARRAGLGLCVRDHHTETNRDPHTLSGGETFYVSLCLALGLADVVTSEAGGIALDTLFIDEGFGSLDAETLDGVLGELGRLQAAGRAVGIVSHVAELKTRIRERVAITPRVGGGSTLAVLA